MVDVGHGEFLWCLITDREEYEANGSIQQGVLVEILRPDRNRVAGSQFVVLFEPWSTVWSGRR
jgi:hypothetical protein